MAENQSEPNTKDADAEEKSAVNTVYILYLAGFITFVTSIVGLVLAHSNRRGASEWVRSHYDFQIRTFWIGLVCLGVLIFVIVVAPLVVPGIVGFSLAIIIMLIWPIWWVLRCVKGMTFLGGGQSITGDDTSPERRSVISRWRVRGAIVAVVISGALVATAVGIAASGSAFQVTPAQHVLVLDGSKLKRVVKDAGLHFKIPIIERIFVCEMFASRKRVFAGHKVRLSDKTTISIDGSLTTRIGDCWKYYYSARTEERFDRIISEDLVLALRRVFAGYAQSDLATKREDIVAAVRTRVEATARRWGGRVMALSIRFP